ncbi:MAG: hypothetical protein WAO35_20505 [Terriglobia bacterium]
MLCLICERFVAATAAMIGKCLMGRDDLRIAPPVMAGTSIALTRGAAWATAVGTDAGAAPAALVVKPGQRPHPKRDL